MLKLLGLDHVVIRTRDAPRLVAFYRDVLGCRVERETSPQTGLVQLRAGAGLIDVVAIDSALGRAGGGPPAADGRNMDHFCVSVAEFDESVIRAHLSRHGVDAGETRRRYGAQGFGPSIYIEDPDGNTVEIKGPPESGPVR
ncbi:MAG: VOC family protein [Proteobacteria bacterium]|nr:MAG: VOC family protein [Pseudomonadota bacterium]